MRLAADENFDNDMLRGLLRLKPETDIIRVQDVGLAGIDDPTILAWAAREGRLLLTHDVETMPYFAYERIKMGEPMPGLVEVSLTTPLGKIIEDLIVLIEVSREGEWENKVLFIPFR
jgi:predicted nuclease of predicted toxin-antitoxin system